MSQRIRLTPRRVTFNVSQLVRAALGCNIAEGKINLLDFHLTIRGLSQFPALSSAAYKGEFFELNTAYGSYDISIGILLKIEMIALRCELQAINKVVKEDKIVLTYNPGSIFSGRDENLAVLLTRIQIIALGFLMCETGGENLFKKIRCIAFDNFSDKGNAVHANGAKNLATKGSVEFLTEVIEGTPLSSNIVPLSKSEVSKTFPDLPQVVHHNADGFGQNETFEGQYTDRVTTKDGKIAVAAPSLEVISAASNLALTTFRAVPESHKKYAAHCASIEAHCYYSDGSKAKHVSNV